MSPEVAEVLRDVAKADADGLDAISRKLGGLRLSLRDHEIIRRAIRVRRAVLTTDSDPTLEALHYTR